MENYTYILGPCSIESEDNFMLVAETLHPLMNGKDCVNDMAFSANPGFDAKKDKNGRWIVRPNAVYAGNLKKKCS